jgi:aspartate dehydrogenase
MTKTLCLLGCGDLAEIVARAVTGGTVSGYRIAGTHSRTVASARRIAAIVEGNGGGEPCAVCETWQEMISLRPDYIVESASPGALRTVAVPALRAGISLIALSIGALADPEFLAEVETAAGESSARVHIVSGAIGGFDVLRTASLMGGCEVSFDTKKGPASLEGTEVYEDALRTQRKTVFSGNAREAIELFPTKVNVAVAAALATVGPEKLRVSVTSVPGFEGDEHRITLTSRQVRAEIAIYSKTAEIAGWSVLNTLRNLASPIVFG